MLFKGFVSFPHCVLCAGFLVLLGGLAWPALRFPGVVIMAAGILLNICVCCKRKTCPFCGAKIPTCSIKCPSCGKWLSTKKRDDSPGYD